MFSGPRIVVLLLLLCCVVPAQEPSNPGPLPQGKPTQVSPATVPSEFHRKERPVRTTPPSRKLSPQADKAPVFVLPPVDVSKLVEEDRRGGSQKRVRIGLIRETSISPQQMGTWTPAASAEIWRLNVVSPEAEALRLHLKGLDLPPGAELYLYSTQAPEEIERVRGKGAEGDGQHWSRPLVGEEVAIELQAPVGLREEVKFTVAGIGHFYAKAGGENGTMPGACNLEPACYPEWKPAANTAPRITFNDSQYIYYCSAVLVNNGAGDYTPLLLTAKHCLSTDELARTLWTNFRNREGCGGSLGDGDAYTLRGARMLAAAPNSDISLLLLTGKLPPSVAAFAGWSLDAPATGSSGTGIHHPRGGLQKISFGKLFTPSPDWPESHPVQWDGGVTEPGSSGSPLFTPERLVLGVLSGGSSSCTNPLNPDYYAKLSSAYPALQSYLTSGVPNDGFEPNNARASAAAISLPANLQRMVLKLGDEDWYRFTVTGPKLITLNLTTAAEDDAILYEVYRGQESAPLDLSQGPIPLYDATSQQFYVRVRLGDTVHGEYDLQLGLTDPVTPTVIVDNHYFDYRTSDLKLKTTLGGWPGKAWGEWSRTADFAEVIKSADRALYGPEANTFTTFHTLQDLVPKTQYYGRGVLWTPLHGRTTTPVVAFMTPDLPTPVPQNPNNGAQNVEPTITLRWHTYPACLDSEVYFGTTAEPPLVASIYLDESYKPSKLATGTTYFWRIGCRYQGALKVSALQSFSTRQDYYKIVPEMADFGSLLAGSATPAKVPLQIRNNSPWYSFAYVSVAEGPFTLEASSCAQLPPGTSCTALVSFQPGAPGIFTGIMNVNLGPDAFYTVPLKAEVGEVRLKLHRPARTPRSGTPATQTFQLQIATSQAFRGTAQLACSGPAAGVTCNVHPQAVELRNGSADATVTVQAPARSQRLRARHSETIRLKVHATVQGLTRTVELPVTIKR